MINNISKNNKLSSVVAATLIGITLFVSISLGLAWIYTEYQDYQNMVSQTKNNFIDDEKKYLSSNVNNTIKLIEYNHSIKEKEIKKLTKERVYEAYSIMEAIYNKNKDIKTKNEIIDEIKEALRHISFFDGKGYYFIIDLKAKLILHSTKPNLENTYELKKLKSEKNEPFIHTWIDNIHTKKEDYSSWVSSNTTLKQKDNIKIGFYKLFEPYNLIVATADYRHRIEKVLQDNLLDKIKALRTHNKEHIFIINKKGDIIIPEYFDAKKIKKERVDIIVKKILQTSNETGVYLDYIWKNKQGNENEMLSYLKTYNNWDWIIGTGVSFDSVNKLINQRHQILEEHIKNEIIFIILLIILISIFTLIFISILNNKIKRSLIMFLDFFRKVDTTNEKINIEYVSFEELRKIAKYANKMIDIRLRNEEDLLSMNREVMINISLLNEYKKVVDVSSSVLKLDTNNKITYINQQLCDTLGYKKEDLLNKNHNILNDTYTNKRFKYICSIINKKKIWKGILKFPTNTNTQIVKSTIIPILDIKGNIKEFISIMHDVTDLMQKINAFQKNTIDISTGLSNRQQLLKNLEEKDNLKLMIINISNFREINNCYGFNFTENILIALAKKLSIFSKKHNIDLYKLPSDEFALLANNIEKSDFKQIANDFINNKDFKEFTINGEKIIISFVIGVSFEKNHLSNAEMAINYAKDEKTNIIYFDDDTTLKEKILNQNYWVKKIREKLNNDKVVVVAQAIYANDTKKLEKYECLIRLEDDDGSLIPPVKFLHIAKKEKIYNELTKKVIEKSFKYFSDKTDTFSINLSIEDILNSETVIYLRDKIKEYNIGNRLIIELIEDEGIEKYEEVRKFIETMKFLECSIAIDDFGTGYSNFDHLMKLNVDFIKIDGSMIRYLDQDKNAQVVIELIVNFAKKLNIKTIAEFVHSKEIQDIVKDLNIDFSQGYHLGKPEKIT